MRVYLRYTENACHIRRTEIIFAYLFAKVRFHALRGMTWGSFAAIPGKRQGERNNEGVHGRREKFFSLDVVVVAVVLCPEEISE